MIHPLHEGQHGVPQGKLNKGVAIFADTKTERFGRLMDIQSQAAEVESAHSHYVREDVRFWLHPERHGHTPDWRECLPALDQASAWPDLE